MSGLTKEILAELGVLGVSVPRCIVIPSVANYPETDLLNIQMNVMDMLVDDHEISKIVSNCWSLAVDIKAFNVQKQCWDLLDLEDDLELPHRASIQVIITDNEEEQETDQRNVSKRDPRLKLTAESEDRHSRRDPRRKQKVSEEIDLDTEDDLPRSVTYLSLLSEPDPLKLSRNDPRRKKLLEKTQPGNDRTLPVEVQTSRSSASFTSTESLQPLTATDNRSNYDSDSDEGNLQIDEGFDDKISRKTPINRKMITESQLSVGGSEKVSSSQDDVGDKDLWDEIYGVSESPDSPLKIFDPQLSKAGKTNSAQEDVIFEKAIKPKGSESSGLINLAEKSLEQLNREKELLLNLVAERDKMNEIVAQTHVEITLDNEIEEGELSDSSNDLETVKDKDSDVEIVTPTSPVEVRPVEAGGNVRPDFVSPASPTARQFDFENDEIDIIPLEREVDTQKKSDVQDLPDVIEVSPSNVPSVKYKKYWEQFTREEELALDKSERDQFLIAREKLSKFKNQEKKKERKSFEPPKALFQKAAGELQVAREKRREQPGPPVPPKEMFLKAAQRSGISPFTAINRTEQMSLSQPGGSSFINPNLSMRKGIALLNTPIFPPPVKVTNSLPASSARSSSSVPPPASKSSNFSFPPPPPQIFLTPSVNSNSNNKSEDNPVPGNMRNSNTSNVWMKGWSNKESKTSNKPKNERFRRDGRKRNESGDFNRGRRRSRSRSPRRRERLWNINSSERNIWPGSWQGQDERSAIPGAPERRERTSGMKESERALLCFYEGGDSIEEVTSSTVEARQFPEPVRATNTAGPGPGHSNNKQKDPVSHIYSYIRRMNYLPPRFKERWGPCGGWAFDVSVGPNTYSCPLFKTKKKDAKAEACRYALQMLGALD